MTYKFLLESNLKSFISISYMLMRCCACRQEALALRTGSLSADSDNFLDEDGSHECTD